MRGKKSLNEIGGGVRGERSHGFDLPLGAVTCRTMTVPFGSGFRAIGTTGLTARPNSRLHRSLRLVAQDTQRLEVGFIVSAALGNVDDVVNL